MEAMFPGWIDEVGWRAGRPVTIPYRTDFLVRYDRDARAYSSEGLQIFSGGLEISALNSWRYEGLKLVYDPFA